MGNKVKMDKKDLSKIPENIVHNIFERSGSVQKGISSILSYYKGAPKAASSDKHQIGIPSNIKPLPVAIDIGMSDIKMIILGKNESKKLQIVGVDHQPQGTGALKDIALRNPVGTLCVSSLPAKKVSIYDLSFPSMPESELQSAIEYKVSQLKPFGLSKKDIIFKWRAWNITEGVSEDSQKRIMVACVARDTVNTHIAILKDAGFHPARIVVPQFSLSDLGHFYKEARKEGELTLWVHLGAEESFIDIEKDGVLCFSGKISLTSNEITNVISKQCKVSLKEADMLKKEYGFSFRHSGDDRPSQTDVSQQPTGTEKAEEGEEPNDKERQVHDALISLLENFVIDIEHSFKYFSYQITKSQITSFDRVILAGGGANLKNLAKFLSVRLGVPVENCDPFSLFEVSENIRHQKSDCLKESPAFALCAALCSERRSKEFHTMNFIPDERSELVKAVEEIFQYTPVKILAGLLAIALFISGFQVSGVVSHKKALDDLSKQLRNEKSILSKLEKKKLDLVKEESSLIQRKELLVSQLNLLQRGFRGPADFSVILGSIASLLPEEAWINDIEYKDGELTITGSTMDLSLITKLITSMKDSDQFISVNFSYTQKDTSLEVYTFEVIANIAI